jgi:hypothetical protein
MSPVAAPQTAPASVAPVDGARVVAVQTWSLLTRPGLDCASPACGVAGAESIGSTLTWGAAEQGPSFWNWICLLPWPSHPHANTARRRAVYREFRGWASLRAAVQRAGKHRAEAAIQCQLIEAATDQRRAERLIRGTGTAAADRTALSTCGVVAVATAMRTRCCSAARSAAYSATVCGFHTRCRSGDTTGDRGRALPRID